MIGDLDILGVDHGTDQSSLGHDYLNVLEPFLEPIRGEARVVVEVGVAGGASIRVWRDYFRRAICIYGIDHNPKSCELALGPNVRLVCGEASDAGFWERFNARELNGGETIEKIDFFSDDGGHHSSQIISTFGYVWPLIATGGIYCAQDLHASYHPAYNRDGGRTAAEFFAKLIDSLNEHGANQCGKPTMSEIACMHFTKSLVIIKKR